MLTLAPCVLVDCHSFSLGPWLLLEHRPCTTSLQRLLSWAILSSCFQLSPICVMSASRSRRQVVFGLPPPLSLALRVPRQGLSRSVSIGLSQSVAKPSPFSLKNFYLDSNLVCSIPAVLVADFVHPQHSQNFPQTLIYKVWILFSVVLFIHHVSAPYRNTDLTFVLNRRSFVVLPIILDFHTFLKMWNAALALLILVFTSASVPPRVSTILPRYLNDSTSSSHSPSSMIGLSQVVSWFSFC